MDDTDTPLEQLYGKVEDLVTLDTSHAYDDGIIAVTDLIENEPDDLEPRVEVGARLQLEMSNLIRPENCEENTHFNNGVCDASVVVLNFFNAAPATPKWYLAEPFQLGADVLDGYEGRTSPSNTWMDAAACRFYDRILFEVREVEKFVTIEIPEQVARDYADTTLSPVQGKWASNAAVIAEASRKALGDG